MSKYWKYLKYVLRHKYFVARMCFKKGLYWRGLVHDNSKFYLFPFKAYAEYFYGGKRVDGNSKTGYMKPSVTKDKNFDMAWLIHQKSEKHHWQFWVLVRDTGEIVPMEMPDKYIKEMICDWVGASIATGISDSIDNAAVNTRAWYEKHKDKMILHEKTREKVIAQLICLSMEI